MIVGSLRSNNLEDKRLSISPESAKSYINLGLNVILENLQEYIKVLKTLTSVLSLIQLVLKLYLNFV